MKRTGLFALLMALAVAISVGQAEDKKKEVKKGKGKKVTSVKCPVAGKEIKIAEAKTVDYKNAKVYVCCAGCVGKMKANAAKYATKANHQLVLTRQARQTKCPLSGGKINKTEFVKIGKTRVPFCCDKCKGKVAAMSADKQLETVFSDAAFKKAFVVKKKKGTKKGTAKKKTDA